jgi:hypothetical protein
MEQQPFDYYPQPDISLKLQSNLKGYEKSPHDMKEL